jgi:hypothetical protein
LQLLNGFTAKTWLMPLVMVAVRHGRNPVANPYFKLRMSHSDWDVTSFYDWEVGKNGWK